MAAQCATEDGSSHFVEDSAAYCSLPLDVNNAASLLLEDGAAVSADALTVRAQNELLTWPPPPEARSLLRVVHVLEAKECDVVRISYRHGDLEAAATVMAEQLIMAEDPSGEPEETKAVDLRSGQQLHSFTSPLTVTSAKTERAKTRVVVAAVNGRYFMGDPVAEAPLVTHFEARGSQARHRRYRNLGFRV